MRMEQTRYRDARGPRGRIERITYQATNVKGATLEKHANVYLPADYDTAAEQRYNVFYLMHGGGGNEDAWLDSCPVKNVLDRLNSEGALAPTIVVWSRPLRAATAPGPGAWTRRGFAPPGCTGALAASRWAAATPG